MIEINKIYNENCLDTMSRIPDDFIDLVVTSPPYDNLRKYNGYIFDFKPIARELYRIMKNGAVIIWVVGDSTINGSESGTSFNQALFFKEIGFNLHDTMIYQKINYIPLTHNRYEQSFEYMFCLTKGKPTVFNPIKIPTKGGGTQYNLKRKGYCNTIKEGAQRRRDENITIGDTKIHSNVFQYSCGSSRVNHPAPFPKELAKDQILSWSNESDLVYDPFIGSGTTALMAKQNNRNYIGSEISKQYFDLCESRLILKEPAQQILF